MSKLRETDVERDCYTVDDFCTRHNISRASFYNLRKAGIGPREMRVLGRIMITPEAARDWRAEREAAANTVAA